MLLGRETIYRDGRRVGWLASGGWGYTLGRSIGFGYVRDPENGVVAADVLSGTYELEVGTDRVPAEVFLKPPTTPTGRGSGADAQNGQITGTRPTAMTKNQSIIGSPNFQ